jgi:Asp-tRNA(Asn)/Glu-tRNA(Gln) amidotransferase B subunit
LLGQLAAREARWTSDIVPAVELAELVKLVETKKITGECQDKLLAVARSG